MLVPLNIYMSGIDFYEKGGNVQVRTGNERSRQSIISIIR